ADVAIDVGGPAFGVEREEIDRRAGLAGGEVGAAQLVLEEVARELAAGTRGIRAADARGREGATDAVDGEVVELAKFFRCALPVADVRFVPGFPIPLLDFRAAVFV